jgi:D-alanyl-lipoteichoic acid acyltransferase DltB (MBOAT superfamily)
MTLTDNWFWQLSQWLQYNENEPLVFTSLFFWVFYAFVLGVYSVVYRHMPFRNAFLFFVSLYFYYKTSGFFFTILLFSTLTDYLIGFKIADAKSEAGRKLWLGLSIFLNLGVLIYFKYAYFFADSFNAILGSQYHPINHFAKLTNQLTGSTFRVDQILLPVGISFFTFQTMSYAIDVYRKEIPPVRNLLDFGFYVSFFPQLVAGPIVRAAEFIPQLYRPYQLSREMWGMSLFWILNGLMKKVFLADFIAIRLVDRVFDNPTSYTGFENLLALYGYSLQVYADFSGYTDIAIGVAMLLGFTLPKNFNSPYKAIHPGEFWRRWHISLSTWLRDYLYIPMGGNRGHSLFTWITLGIFLCFVMLIAGTWEAIFFTITGMMLLVSAYGLFPRFGKWLTTNINMMMTMLLGGLWHGACWNFVIWGGLNGLGIMLTKLFVSKGVDLRKIKWYVRFLAVFVTFHFITFTRIWFRSGSKNTWEDMNEKHLLTDDLATANQMLKQLFTKMDFSIAPQVIEGYALVCAVMVGGFIIHWLPEMLKQRYRKAFAHAPIALQFAITCVAALIIYQVLSLGMNPFIYFQF